MKESDIVKKIIQQINSLPGFHVWRQNTGAMKTGNRFIRFGAPGAPDIAGIGPGGRAIFIECKKPGGKLSEQQKNFLWNAAQRDALCIIAYSLQDALNGIGVKNA